MVVDLGATDRVGVGRVLFPEVDLRMARGAVPFKCGAWRSNFFHAFKPRTGWSGSGGYWGRGSSRPVRLAFEKSIRCQGRSSRESHTRSNAGSPVRCAAKFSSTAALEKSNA